MKDYYYLGYISRTHGKQTSVLIELDTDQPSHYHALQLLFIEREGMPLPLRICALSPLRPDVLKVDFEAVQQADITPRSLIGQAVFLPLSSLPPLGGAQFYYHEVIGFHALSEQKLLGLITDVRENRTAQDLFVIGCQGREALVPIIDEFIERVDRSHRAIHLRLPRGLLDLYL